MVETWIYVAGGIIVAVIAFVIAYNLISSSIEYSQRQDFLTQFSRLGYSINEVCIQEINNSFVKKFSIPFSVRVVYATDNIDYILPTVTDKIKNEQLSYGQNICFQFKKEQYLRCYPEPPKKMSCNITMPYIGALEETEDIWIKVSKILGGPTIREYELFVRKTGGEEVTVTFPEISVPSTTSSTTPIGPTTTTTTLPII